MKGDIDSGIARESLKRISASFELELLRLIKTLNLISQSKELYKGQITFIQALTDKYKLGLSGFTIKLLDIERKSREPSPARDPDNLFATPDETALSPASVAGIVNEIRAYLDVISTDIEKNKNEYLSKLDSVYSVYNLQLGASQTDLDLKLRELQKEISRISESNGSGVNEQEQPEDVTRIDYVKPSLQQTETVRPRERNIDYIGPDEPKKQIPHKPGAQAAPDAKPKTDIKSTARTVTEDEDKDAKIKNSYILGAGLLILGIIVGVLFYDMLMRMWGVEEVSVADSKTYSNVESANDARPKIPPPAVKEKPNTAPVTGPGNDKVKQDNKLFPQAKPSDGKTMTNAEVAAVKKTSLAPPQVKQPGQVPARSSTGALESYTVVGVGANVRSGPGMGNDVVTTVKEGDVFRGLGEKKGRWVKISAPDGKEGWISEKVIREAQ